MATKAPTTLDLELSDAKSQLVAADMNDTGADLYRVTALDRRFGDRLVIAEFSFDNSHERGFYKVRAEFMARMLCNIINGGRA